MVCFVALAVILPFVSAVPAKSSHEQPNLAQEKRQYNPPPSYRAQAVVDTFRLSWAGYYTYAFPNDELKPVTNSFGNSRCVQTEHFLMGDTDSTAMAGVLQPPMRSAPRSLWARKR